jgi:hypothetical protein
LFQPVSDEVFVGVGVEQLDHLTELFEKDEQIEEPGESKVEGGVPLPSETILPGGLAKEAVIVGRGIVAEGIVKGDVPGGAATGAPVPGRLGGFAMTVGADAITGRLGGFAMAFVEPITTLVQDGPHAPQSSVEDRSLDSGGAELATGSIMGSDTGFGSVKFTRPPAWGPIPFAADAATDAEGRKDRVAAPVSVQSQYPFLHKIRIYAPAAAVPSPTPAVPSPLTRGTHTTKIHSKVRQR